MIPKEVSEILSQISDGKIWVYILIFVVFSYLLISFFTWSFKKPLKYLGIPTLIIGILFIIIRFFSSLILSIFEVNYNLGFVKVLIPSILKPILVYGVVCVLLGIIMLIVYNVINNNRIEDRQIESL